MLGREVKMAPDCIGPEVREMAEALEPGGVMLLENLRFHPGEKENDPDFSGKLAELADIYVNDAFGVAHRAHASVVGVVEKSRQACAGILLQKEWEYLNKAMEGLLQAGHPEKSLVQSGLHDSRRGYGQYLSHRPGL
jgi:phosphoglycerate kinase